MNKKLFSITTAVLAVMIISSGVDLAYAAQIIPDEIKQKALEGKQTWDKIEDKKEEIKRDISEEKKDEIKDDIEKLEVKFDEYVKEMNAHGIATPEQWEKDREFWRMKNLPPVPEASVNGTSITPLTTQMFPPITKLGLTPSSDATTYHPIPVASSCYCPQAMHFIMGYDFQVWGFWWTTAASPWGWSQLDFTGDFTESNITTLEDHDKVDPFVKYTLQKPGYGHMSSDYKGTAVNGYIFDMDANQHLVTSKVTPDRDTWELDRMYNVNTGADFLVESTLISLN